MWCFKWDTKSSKVCFRFVVCSSSLLSFVMLWEGRAMAGCERQRDRTRRVAGISKDTHRALNVVSTAFVGCFFPFPSFNFAFCSTEYQKVSGTSNKMAKKSITEKSATFSFFFFELFGMVGVADQVYFDRVRCNAPPGPPRATTIEQHTTDGYPMHDRPHSGSAWSAKSRFTIGNPMSSSPPPGNGCSKS